MSRCGASDPGVKRRCASWLSPMSQMGARCALACLVALAGAAPASAATATTLAGYSRATPISATATRRSGARTTTRPSEYTLTLKLGDTIRALPLPPREHEFDATVGRGAGGRLLVAYARLPARRPLRGLRLRPAAQRERSAARVHEARPPARVALGLAQPRRVGRGARRARTADCLRRAHARRQAEGHPPLRCPPVRSARRP